MIKVLPDFPCLLSNFSWFVSKWKQISKSPSTGHRQSSNLWTVIIWVSADNLRSQCELHTLFHIWHSLFKQKFRSGNDFYSECTVILKTVHVVISILPTVCNLPGTSFPAMMMTCGDSQPHASGLLTAGTCEFLVYSPLSWLPSTDLIWPQNLPNNRRLSPQPAVSGREQG